MGARVHEITGGRDEAAVDGEKRTLWVFAYGSLMWRPDFPFIEALRARLDGFNRRFCIYSIHHRGSPARPGLILGLDRGGSCEGLAYRVASAQADHVLACLRAREQVTGVYREVSRPVALQDGSGRAVTALAFVAERAHRQYARDLPLQVQARIILGASGRMGANLDYLLRTAMQTARLGIFDRRMERLLALVGPHLTRGGPAAELAARMAGLAKTWQRAPGPRRRIARSCNLEFAHRRVIG